MKYCFGIDVGGTTVKCGLFTIEGKLEEKWEIPTRIQDNGKYIFSDIAETIKNKIKERSLKEVVGVGVGIPGPVEKDGHVSKITNICLEDINPAKELEKLLGIPVKAGNDANVAALGEQWIGGGKNYTDIVMVTLGTGIGWGIIVDGKILNGSHGAAGETGHIHVRDNEPETCGCGNKGCLEQYCSANGIAKEAVRKVKATTKPSVLRKEEKISSKIVFDAAKQGDELSIEILNDWAKQLANVLATVATVVDPQAFIIGGGVSKAGSYVTELLTKYYKEYAFHAQRGCKIELATLGNDAGIYGSAKMMID